MAMDSAVYFVMRHYSLSLREVHYLTPSEFDQMFTWAAAATAHEAKQQKEAQRKGQKVESTDYGSPMPYSEGW